MILFPEKNAFGLDISDTALRLVLLNRSGKKFSIVSYNELPLSKDIVKNGDILNQPILIQQIKKLIATAKGRKVPCHHVCAVLPETKTFIKLLRISIESPDTIEQHLATEMTKHIPYSMNEIYFDWQIIGELKAGQKNDILVGAAPIVTVDQYISTLKQAGLIPLALEIEAASITRSLFPIDPKKDNTPKIIVDLGASRSSLIAYENSIIHFTVSLAISGDEITRKISERLKLDPKKAEEAKILCGLDEKKCSGALKKILMNNVNTLMKKIEEIIYFYRESSSGSETIQKIILSGGGGQLLSLDKLLQEHFKIAVELGNPLANISKMEKGAQIPKKKLSSFATAIGLSLRCFE